MRTEKTTDVRDEIMDWLKENERNLHWLSGKCMYNYNTMYSIFVQKIIKLSNKRLNVINIVLGTKFTK